MVTLPNNLVHEIQLLPNCDQFISDALSVALEQRKRMVKPSKWARIAQRIDAMNPRLGDYTDQFKRDMREIREGIVLGADE